MLFIKGVYLFIKEFQLCHQMLSSSLGNSDSYQNSYHRLICRPKKEVLTKVSHSYYTEIACQMLSMPKIVLKIHKQLKLFPLIPIELPRAEHPNWLLCLLLANMNEKNYSYQNDLYVFLLSLIFLPFFPLLNENNLIFYTSEKISKN